MDKLEPIMKNHFWILLVPLLSMNLWGYFSANGALKEATKARESALDTVKSGIPAGATDPNEVYATELKKRNEVLEKYVNEELLDLWKRQQALMVWPPRVAADIPKLYLADIKDNKVRYTYQTDYQDVVQQLHERVEPYVLDQRGIKWTPKVDFPIELIPQMKIGSLTITSKQMWDAQEDVWVTRFILEAIRAMNKDADSETSAVIRRVIAYRLLGGDGVAKVEGGGEADASGSDSGAPMTTGFSISGGQGVDGRSEGIASAVIFDPAEEFGVGGEAVGVGAGGSSIPTMMPSDEESTAEGTEPTGPLRYVKDTPEATYVERGFYLSVIINQNKVVDFLVALSNSEWPVRVVRFQFGKNPYAIDPFSAAQSLAGNQSSMSSGPRGFGAAPMPSPLSSFSGQPSPQGFGIPSGSGMAAVAATGFPPDALQHPDLVQLDLAGLVTMYRQPKEEIDKLTAPATDASAAPETSAEAPADPAAETPAEPVTPAEVDPAAGTPPAGSGTPVEAPGAVAPAPAEAAPVESTPAESTPAESTPAATPVVPPPDPAVPSPAGAAPPAAAKDSATEVPPKPE